MTRAGRLVLRIAGMAPVMALLASPSLLRVEDIGAPAKAAIEKQVRSPLTQMSTGEGQVLVEEGHNARVRNAAIPIAPGQRLALAAYAPFVAGSPAHATAQRCLTQAIYYEAANEPERGKRAVAQVVLNRMRHPAYPNTVCGVVYQGVNARVCQFSFTCDGALLRRPLQRQWNESRRIATEALAGSTFAPVGTATHYHANYVVPRWAYTLQKLEVIGTHIFYRFPGRAGSGNAFVARWAGSERIPAINWSRFAARAAESHDTGFDPVEEYVPGLTVTPDVTDRHARNDVGGRLDTTKQWRLSIPDPVTSKGSYGATVALQAKHAPPSAEPPKDHARPVARAGQPTLAASRPAEPAPKEPSLPDHAAPEASR